LTLNQEHLKHDYYTDIITFDYSTETYIAGDLFISIDRVLENASVEKVPFDEELHRVVYHGLLHLLGYNDKNQEEIRTMRSKENYYLTKLFHVKH
jgi:rRNA maturation RNase YbeY